MRLRDVEIYISSSFIFLRFYLESFDSRCHGNNDTYNNDAVYDNDNSY